MTTNKQSRDQAGRFEAATHSRPEVSLDLEAFDYQGPNDRRSYDTYARAANATGGDVFTAFADASMQYDWGLALEPE
jgi:hypothetical protein